MRHHMNDVELKVTHVDTCKTENCKTNSKNDYDEVFHLDSTLVRNIIIFNNKAEWYTSQKGESNFCYHRNVGVANSKNPTKVCHYLVD